MTPVTSPLPTTASPSHRRTDRLYWRRRNHAYHIWVERHIASIVPAGRSVLDLRCEAGDLLNRVRPRVGVGITPDPRLAAVARARYPHLEFRVGNPEQARLERSYDYIL